MIYLNYYITISNGIIIQWGTANGAANTTGTRVTFPTTFRTLARIHVQPAYGANGEQFPNTYSIWAKFRNYSISGFNISTGFGSNDAAIYNCHWIAIGY